MHRAALAFLLLTPLCTRAQEGIPTMTLADLKSATVFVQVSTRSASGSGSGFLIEQHKNTGYAVTNAHVVTNKGKIAKQVKCVFWSGSREELIVQRHLAWRWHG